MCCHVKSRTRWENKTWLPQDIFRFMSQLIDAPYSRGKPSTKKRWKRQTNTSGELIKSHPDDIREAGEIGSTAFVLLSCSLQRTNVAWARVRSAAAAIVKTDKFDALTGAVIVLNCVFIGMDQTSRLHGKQTHTYELIEQLFLAVYIVEFLLQFFARGRRIVHNSWLMFDLFLILFSVITQWILMPLLHGHDQALSKMVLRLARLARLARSVKLLVKIRTLWILVKGLICSAKIVGHTFVLLCIMLYVLAILGVELIRFDAQYKHGEVKYRQLVDQWFPNIPYAMLSLLQFVCLDSIGSIYRPFIEMRFELALYFTTVILLAAFVFMNIVTAVIVNSALEQASADREVMIEEKENRKLQLMEDLKDVFMALDTDKSGHLEREEVLAATIQDVSSLRDFMDCDAPVEVFDQLDVNGCGMLSIDDFCEGLYECAMSGTPIELKRIEKIASIVKEEQKSVLAYVKEIKDAVGEVASLMKVSLSRTPVPATPSVMKFNETATVGLESYRSVDSLEELMPQGPELLQDARFDVPPWGRQVLSQLLEIEASIKRMCAHGDSESYCSNRASTEGAKMQPTKPESKRTAIPRLPCSGMSSETAWQVRPLPPVHDMSGCQPHFVEVDGDADESDEFPPESRTLALPRPFHGLGYATGSWKHGDVKEIPHLDIS